MATSVKFWVAGNTVVALSPPGRSIPAHAGEPRSTPGLWPARTVYPRPRGGARGVVHAGCFGVGLSPPTRGSPRDHSTPGGFDGSIPAHAGEPPPARRAAPCPGVYPRPRGGAISVSSSSRTGTGLSPPTRGSLGEGEPAHLDHGSIPAHAGEPQSEDCCVSLSRVYPRPRGGAPAPDPDFMILDGLSPPTRGSLIGEQADLHLQRSIPAHAGEPAGRADPGHFSPVYPRPRGGARVRLAGGTYREGLSPPTRGSPQGFDSGAGHGGSIPAHAGEPGQPR